MSREETQPAPTSVKLPPRPEEARLIEIAVELAGQKIGCVSSGRGQIAEALAKQCSQAEVFCWYYDAFYAGLARKAIEPQPNLQILCQPDWPDGQTLDLAAIATASRSESELTREVIQGAFHSLAIGGQLVVSIDHVKDRWLHDLLKGYEKSVKVRRFDDAIVYYIVKTAPLKKLKDFTSRQSYKDCDTVIEFITRPGVFSHREFDAGGRHLLDAVDVYPEARLLDIGCGSGTVALGLAARDPQATVHAIDANTRAVACTAAGAVLNGFENVVAAVNYDGQYLDEAAFDMALANPPYFADFKIAEHFVRTGHRSLRSGGRIVIVTKQPRWYEEHLPELFDECEVYESKKYFIASGVKP